MEHVAEHAFWMYWGFLGAFNLEEAIFEKCV